MRLGMMPYLGGTLAFEEKGTLSLCGTPVCFEVECGLVGYPFLVICINNALCSSDHALGYLSVKVL